MAGRGLLLYLPKYKTNSRTGFSNGRSCWRIAEGDKPGQIASDLGMKPETLRKRLSRARSSMQQAYEG